MDKKDYCVEISFSGRLKLNVSAENEEDARTAIFNAISTMDIESSDKDVSIEEIEWDLIDEEPQGNRATPYVSDMTIEEC